MSKYNSKKGDKESYSEKREAISIMGSVKVSCLELLGAVA
jgi:hypothetical protein